MTCLFAKSGARAPTPCDHADLNLMTSKNFEPLDEVPAFEIFSYMIQV